MKVNNDRIESLGTKGRGKANGSGKYTDGEWMTLGISEAVSCRRLLSVFSPQFPSEGVETNRWFLIKENESFKH